MKRVMIAGCGYVGTEAGRMLVEKGIDVFGLKRNPETLPAFITPVHGDLEQPETLDNLPADLDAVVISVSAGSFDEPAYRRIYVTGVKNLLEALDKPGFRPGRIIFTSSTGVYGQTDGQLVDESSPTRPSSFSGQVMLIAEQQVLNGPFPACVLRLGGIYGPGRVRILEQIAESKARIPSAPVHTNRIHRFDAARAIVHVLRLPQPDPVYNVVDEDPVEFGEMIRWLADKLGVPCPPEAGADETVRSRGGNKRVFSGSLRGSGFLFRYPTFREGYGPMIDRFKNSQ